MKEVFHFPAIRRLISLPHFNFVYDAMNGVSGPYAKKLFIEELGANPACLMRATPLVRLSVGPPTAIRNCLVCLIQVVLLSNHMQLRGAVLFT